MPASSNDPLRGLDTAAASLWLERNVDEIDPPFDFELIAAGGSNLTYRVTPGSGPQVVLRRPPGRHGLPTAHDMNREYRILSALHGTANAVPVPRPLASCEDLTTLGVPFYVMEFVPGLILRDEATARSLSAEQCATATASLVDVQVAMHAIDPGAVGLDDFKRPGAYVNRQLERWRKQAERARTRDLPLLSELHQRLVATAPPEAESQTIAHGDYRFDNTVIDESGRVVAVLDWELCTVGDPVADFCWSLMYWADPGDPYHFLASPPTLYEGFARRNEIAALYRSRSDRSLDALPWFLAFGWWKMACIVEGVYARLKAGAGGGMSGTEGLDAVAARVDQMLELGTTAAQEIGS